MTPEQEFALAVRDMRQAQRAYFAQRSNVRLKRSIALEQRVDALLKHYEEATGTKMPTAPQGNNQKELFGNQ